MNSGRSSAGSFEYWHLSGVWRWMCRGSPNKLLYRTWSPDLVLKSKYIQSLQLTLFPIRVGRKSDCLHKPVEKSDSHACSGARVGFAFVLRMNICSNIRVILSLCKIDSKCLYFPSTSGVFQSREKALRQTKSLAPFITLAATFLR